MTTEDNSYSAYLENKYLPGRRYYLNRLFYPKLFQRFDTADPILDLGCGTGEFLHYCRTNNREAIGVDSNEALAKKCENNGFSVVRDNICELTGLNGRRFKHAICDNVLEHLEIKQVEQFFERMDSLLLPGGKLICVVPGRKGFQKDPTHKTYISHNLIANLLKNRGLKLERFYYHPFDLGLIDKYLYLNMQVFELTKD